MPLIPPVKTMGGLTWWTSLRSDSLLVLQQHSAPAVWWGKPFRILLAESKICIATCSTKDEGMGDFENITKLVEAALPRHLQLTSTAMEYENSVLAFIGDYVRRGRSSAAPEPEAVEELLDEENISSPPLSPSRHEDEGIERVKKRNSGRLATSPPAKLHPAASAPLLISQTPGGECFPMPHIPARVDHIFILVHGINGKVTDMQDFEHHLKQIELFSNNTVIFRSGANQEAGTHQGIEIAGIRLTAEIMEILQRVPEGQTPRFSIAAHSLGGLISRCAIGKLEMLGAFTRVIPTTFMTMCTPHLSSRRVGGVFGHYGKAIWQKMVHYVVQQQGETGKELLLADCENGAPPLLVRMTDLESEYMKGLRRFEHPTAIGVSTGDLLVPYASALMRAHNPHPIPPWNAPNVLSVQDFSHFPDAYLPLFTRFIRRAPHPPFLPTNDPPPEETENGFCCDRLHTVEFTNDMFRNLNTVPWRRLEIQYGGGVHGLHIHEQVIKCKKHWKAPLLNEATATESVSLFCAILRNDHSAPPHPPAGVSSPVSVSQLASYVGSMSSPPSAAPKMVVIQSSSPAPSPQLSPVPSSPTHHGHSDNTNAKEEEKPSVGASGMALAIVVEMPDGVVAAAEGEKPKRLIEELREP